MRFVGGWRVLDGCSGGCGICGGTVCGGCGASMWIVKGFVGVEFGGYVGVGVVGGFVGGFVNVGFVEWCRVSGWGCRFCEWIVGGFVGGYVGECVVYG